MKNQLGRSSLNVLLLIALLVGAGAYFWLKKPDSPYKAAFQDSYSQVAQAYKALANLNLGGTDFDAKGFLKGKLSVAKWCDNQVITNGCWTNTMVPPTDAKNQAGFVLANGVTVTDINNSPSNDGLFMDLNGPLPPNKLGEDTLALGVCLNKKQDAGCDAKAWAAPGYTGPTGLGELYPSDAPSLALWEKLKP